jgi:hypothetical protein
MTYIIKELKQQGRWEQEQYISAKGLVPVVEELGLFSDRIIGVEIGVAGGWNMNYFLSKLPKLFLTGIDPFAAYQETRGSDGQVVWVGQEVLDEHHAAALANIADYPSGRIIRSKSLDTVNVFKDESLDYVFIDGDHSYDAVLDDCRAFYSKVRSGGVFAGHDIGLGTVQSAIKDFAAETPGLDIANLLTTEHAVWYWYKP